MSTVTANTSSDRKVRLLAILVAVSAILMVALELASHAEGLSRYNDIISGVEIVAGAVAILAVARSTPLALGEMNGRRLAALEALEARKQVEQLFQMTDMLQSAIGHADANAVLRATASQLLTGFGGALYVFNNSRDRLDLSTTWDWPDGGQPQDTVSPAHCWALKRGKPHVNHVGGGALRCEHVAPDIQVLEIPMMARGEVYGLLIVQADGNAAAAGLAQIAPAAGAIADAMSLALSNIALREKLRTQALRDPLTGLYNRRYMEDVLERFAGLSERNGSPLSAIMIDLDHFKKLNDDHGHALGDAVLREVAVALVGTIRPCDVACRYGGEELVVLLPDCPLNEAVAKAEVLRARIESLSENHATRVTASFGVAALRETSERAADLLAHADAALYRAKQEGRNRVLQANRRRPGGLETQLPAAAE